MIITLARVILRVEPIDLMMGTGAPWITEALAADNRKAEITEISQFAAFSLSVSQHFRIFSFRTGLKQEVKVAALMWKEMGLETINLSIRFRR